jgi:hypothetical protein
MKRAIAVSTLLAACTPTVESHLTIPKVGDQSAFAGFHCRPAGLQTPPIADRARDGVASMVIDHLRLGGFPSCRQTPLAAWCETEGCRPIPEARRCFPLDLAGATGCGGGDDGGALCKVTRSIEGLTGNVVSDDAPDEAVIIRAVGVALACDDVPPPTQPFPPAELIGCS